MGDLDEQARDPSARDLVGLEGLDDLG
ncbi:hypothetical protein PPSIR1_23159 [Plesiocystis pacifica SIR-1]|uniref:Uncharacterized protein n=1 Tax=Plesiocystis pacifica SIR-1 TaxID=391625 RepID=A6GC56_9BACT|nr:hypothetical protein PPSIR1_23159 [Plesiocystis pacifica SIR-1]